MAAFSVSPLSAVLAFVGVTPRMQRGGTGSPVAVAAGGIHLAGRSAQLDPDQPRVETFGLVEAEVVPADGELGLAPERGTGWGHLTQGGTETQTPPPD